MRIRLCAGDCEEGKSGASGKWIGQSQELSLKQQADGPPIALRIAATPALGEGDADAAGNGL